MYMLGRIEGCSISNSKAQSPTVFPKKKAFCRVSVLLENGRVAP